MTARDRPTMVVARCEGRRWSRGWFARCRRTTVVEYGPWWCHDHGWQRVLQQQGTQR